MAGVIRMLFLPCCPPYEIVGESPFALSLLDSSISTNYEPEGSSIDSEDYGSMPQTNAVEAMVETIL